MKKYYLLCSTLLVLLAAVLFSSCDSSTDAPPPPKKVYAGTNSTFTYKKTYKDPAGNPAGADTSKTATVIEGPHSYGGKDTTITVVEDGRDTTIMSYESNGDVSLYRGNGLPGAPIPFPVPTWWTLPIKSKGSLAIMDLDTTVTFDIGGFTVTLKKIQGSANYMASETVRVGTEDIACQKVDVKFIVNAQVSILPVTLTFNTSYYFSEKLGFFAKYDTQNTFPDLVLSWLDPGNSVQVLTSYSLK